MVLALRLLHVGVPFATGGCLLDLLMVLSGRLRMAVLLAGLSLLDEGLAVLGLLLVVLDNAGVGPEGAV